jgi:endonuclease YncB( thermonuclease family)
MRNRRAALTAMAALLGISTQSALAEQIVERVVGIRDGDTLTILVSKRQIRVRLSDIDAPERKQPFGTRSRQSLSEICGSKTG